jgi:hypothetical protein
MLWWIRDMLCWCGLLICGCILLVQAIKKIRKIIQQYNWRSSEFLIAILRLYNRQVIHRFNHGLCTFCGYDLRASPVRCPECGNERVRDISYLDYPILPEPIMEPKKIRILTPRQRLIRFHLIQFLKSLNRNFGFGIRGRF